MSNKAAAQMAGISEKTLYNWIECGEKDTSGPFFDFWESLQAATVQFELSNCRIIHRSATEETRIVRQTIRYKSGQAVNGKLGAGKFKSATIVIETRPRSTKSAMWLLERRFPKKWGRQAGGDARRDVIPHVVPRSTIPIARIMSGVKGLRRWQSVGRGEDGSM